MKPRVLVTQKILVAVVTTAAAATAAGCARPATEPSPATAESVVARPREAPPPAEAHETAPPPTEVAADVQHASARVEHASATRVPPPPKPDAKIYLLQSELYELDEERALAEKARFRPLCDADGFPVVGNVMRKSTGYQASSFCAVVRNHKSR